MPLIHADFQGLRDRTRETYMLPSLRLPFRPHLTRRTPLPSAHTAIAVPEVVKL